MAAQGLCPGFAMGGRESALGALSAGPGKQRLLGAKGREAALAFPLPAHLECPYHTVVVAAATMTVVVPAPPLMVIIRLTSV